LFDVAKSVPFSCRYWRGAVRHAALLKGEAMRISRRDFGAVAIATIGCGRVASGPAAAATFQASDRRCATCDFWGGQRAVGADKAAVTVADGTTGICNNPQSPLYNRPTRPDQIFNNGYRRWRELG
jgi:hypothetical protein